MNRPTAERGRRTARITSTALVAVLLVVGSACSGDDGTADPSTAGATQSSGEGTTTDGAVTEPGTADPGTDPGTDAPTTDEPTTTTTEPPTTTTTLPLITKKALVLVANAAGVPGAAGRFTQVLQGVGFAVDEPTDAAGNEIRLDKSKVYYWPEAEKSARSLAEIMGVKALPMPTPAPVLEAMVGLGDANVLVMLGQDLADEAIPGLTDR